MNKLLIVLFFATILTILNTNAKTTKSTQLSKTLNDERTIGSFNGIAVAGPINVIVTLGSKQGCRLEGDAEALATIITEVKGNILIIRPQTSIMSWTRKYEDKKITAYVSATDLASLTMSGSGSMIINEKITTGSLTTTLSGSGSLKLVADVDQYTCVISGSGALTINGSADQAKVIVSSSGTFEGKNLIANTVSTKISGSGTINIKAQLAIKVFISGSGSVNYSGNPSSVEKIIFGSGRVRKV